MPLKKLVIFCCLTFLLIIFSLRILGACSNLRAGEERVKSTPVTIQLLERGTESFQQGSARIHFEVYTGNDAFLSAYAHIHAGVLPTPEPPILDFEKWMVVGAFLGRRPTAGYGIALNSAEARLLDGKKVLDMEVLISEPSKNKLRAQVMTFPYTLVIIPRDQWKVLRFRDQQGKLLGEFALHAKE